MWKCLQDNFYNRIVDCKDKVTCVCDCEELSFVSSSFIFPQIYDSQFLRSQMCLISKKPMQQAFHMQVTKMCSKAALLSQPGHFLARVFVKK